MFFTTTRHFHPSTSGAPSIRADSSRVRASNPRQNAEGQQHTKNKHVLILLQTKRKKKRSETGEHETHTPTACCRLNTRTCLRLSSIRTSIRIASMPAPCGACNSRSWSKNQLCFWLDVGLQRSQPEGTQHAHIQRERAQRHGEQRRHRERSERYHVCSFACLFREGEGEAGRQCSLFSA